jgi:quercetin dioxygenase-like cupin family protein
MPLAAPNGPRTTYRAPHEGVPAQADYPRAPVSRILDASDEGAELFGVLVAIGADIPLHYHPVFELQYVLSGTDWHSTPTVTRSLSRQAARS